MILILPSENIRRKKNHTEVETKTLHVETENLGITCGNERSECETLELIDGWKN